MNRLEEIQEIIKNFIYEKQQMKQQITEIENERNKLAQDRNKRKLVNESTSIADAENAEAEIYELGKRIAELGDRSQELQNKLDSRYIEIKKQVDIRIDNLISEGIREIRKIEEQRNDLEENIALQEARNAKYEVQRQEFFARFGRMPELSENAEKESELQGQEYNANKEEISTLNAKIACKEEEIAELARNKRAFKNGNWSLIVKEEIEQEEVFVEDAITLPLTETEFVEEVPETTELMQEIKEEAPETVEAIEEIKIEEIEPIQEISVEEIEPIQEISLEEIEPIQEIYVEEAEPIQEIALEETKPLEDIAIEKIQPIEELKVEEIQQVEETQTQKAEEQPIAEENIIEEEIITLEEAEEPKTEETVFGEKVTLSNIIAKFEEGEIVYKAQLSNGKTISVYPRKANTGNIILKDKENREELKEILINYAVAEYKTLDKRVIKKIDPIICEVLVRFAKQYNYDAQNLIYNYAMSFSKSEEIEIDAIPSITYNIAYMEGTKLDKKEKEILSKICKNARKNEKVDIIGCNTGLSKIRYILKRTFNANNANALPEGKY